MGKKKEKLTNKTTAPNTASSCTHDRDATDCKDATNCHTTDCKNTTNNKNFR